MSATTFGTAVVVADTAGMDYAEWVKLRNSYPGLGGSDAAAICGQSKYGSALSVWLEKTGAFDDVPDEPTEAMDWGRRLEGVVAEAVVERTGFELYDVKAMLAHPDHDFMMANVDRGARDGAGLDLVYEGKTAGLFAGADWGDADNETVPDAYVLQGMHYLAVTGMDRLLYGVLIGGQRLVIRMVLRDQELIDHLITIETEFWDRVINMDPPPPDGSKATSELLGHLYDVKAESIVTIADVDVVADLISQRAAAAKMEKAAGDAKREAENRLKVMIGEAETAVDPHGETLFRWPQYPASEVKASTRAPYRRLIIPQTKDA